VPLLLEVQQMELLTQAAVAVAVVLIQQVVLVALV
jgi:hypothetical protein